jgi:AraC-like DNA-binding protein
MKNEDFNFTLLNAARVIHDADWNWENVNSPFARLYMVENGYAKVILPDGIHIIKPGYLYLIPSFVSFSCENDSVFTLYYFHIYNEYDIFDRWNLPFEVLIDELDTSLIKRLLTINPCIELNNSNPVSYNNLSTLTQNIANSSSQNYLSFGLETIGILYQLFSRFLIQATHRQEVSDKRIKKVLRYIRENIDKNLYVNDLADICRLTNEHFTRLFKNEMQCTPMQYIIRKKIEKAQLLLITGEKLVKDIAYSLSFEDITHFYHTFKKVTGISPNTYKNQYK